MRHAEVQYDLRCTLPAAEGPLHSLGAGKGNGAMRPEQDEPGFEIGAGFPYAEVVQLRRRMLEAAEGLWEAVAEKEAVRGEPKALVPKTQ